MIEKTVTIEEAQTQLSDLLTLIAQGKEVIIAKGKKPVAKLIPLSQSSAQKAQARTFGEYKGQIWVSDDFDAPLPDDFLAWKPGYVKLLIDTHVFLWLMDEPEKLSGKALEACKNRENQIYLSVVSPWEIEIKRQLGKLRLKLPLRTIIEEQQEKNGLQILAVELEHVLALGNLIRHHADPFDRLLIAQAIVEDADLVTADPLFSKYPVKLYW